MATAHDVAQWMLAELTRDGTLYQEQAVWDIQQTFGDEHVYENENGNMAISRTVLAEFRKLTKGSAVWSRSERFWRLREEYDADQRQQD